MFILVTYDIADDRRRLRVSDELENFGTRVNYSVFECHVEDKHLTVLKERLARIVETEEDNVRYYVICDTCRKKVEVQGNNPVTTNPGYTIV